MQRSRPSSPICRGAESSPAHCRHDREKAAKAESARRCHEGRADARGRRRSYRTGGGHSRLVEARGAADRSRDRTAVDYTTGNAVRRRFHERVDDGIVVDGAGIIAPPEPENGTTSDQENPLATGTLNHFFCPVLINV